MTTKKEFSTQGFEAASLGAPGMIHARLENSRIADKLLERVAVIASPYSTGKEYVMVDKEMKDILHSIFSYFTDNKTSKVIVCPTENASRLSRDKLQHVERNFLRVYD